MEDSQIIELFCTRSEVAISEISAKYGAFAQALELTTTLHFRPNH